MRKSTAQILSLALISMTLTGCQEKEEIQEQDMSKATRFWLEARSNPLIIGEMQFGESWQVVHERYSYTDKGDIKITDIDLLSDPKYHAYKEFWIFGKDSVLQFHRGQLFGKKDAYMAKFKIHPNSESNVITIDFVYDGGVQIFPEDWEITSLTTEQLILTCTTRDQNHFYEYTFQKKGWPW
ncbi:hypothetical protein WSM22_24880 [Cytophagales bacterium WSM2-2]|nr:hypothetical protein WSM22_24880 [Cytophagales bacterium WSM2-2]